MGVRRLMSDLLPYSTQAVLGQPNEHTSGQRSIQNLVIDGPSLVYFVYHRLLTYRALEAGAGAVRLPTYNEIGKAYAFILTELQSSGAEIQAIYFDGALPSGKEYVRLERLDKTRIQLDEFRRLHRDVVPPPASPALPIAFERAIWLRGATFGRRATFPPPPFMVPSVIETLLQSQWHEKIHVVPEEADVACARAANVNGWTILSDDSDLPVYDLGGGCVALLQTLERTRNKSVDSPRIIVSCINPLEIAERLKVPSLRNFAYERSLDGSVSTAIIAQRARAASADAQSTSREYSSFTAEYSIPGTQWAGSSLTRLDPRTAELVVQVVCNGGKSAPRVYLPVLHEDAERDSAWSYGQHIRQLGYSMYSDLSEPAFGTEYVTEYARKGGRINATKIAVLKHVKLKQATSIVLDRLQERLPKTSLQWWALALGFVVQQKLETDKPITRSNIETTVGVSGNHFKYSWVDLHLHANIQSVLYSLRMLSQMLQYIHRSSDRLSEKISWAEPVLTALSRLPPIAELLLDVDGLRTLASGDYQETKRILEEVMTPIGDQSGDRANESALLDTSSSRRQDGLQNATKPPRKRLKKTTERSSRPSVQKTNMFSLLAGDDNAESDGD